MLSNLGTEGMAAEDGPVSLEVGSEQAEAREQWPRTRSATFGRCCL
jgi:hypothetical protein